MFLDAVLQFAVDPQDEADRRESRLAVMADHLGFSWFGKYTTRDGSTPFIHLCLVKRGITIRVVDLPLGLFEVQRMPKNEGNCGN